LISAKEGGKILLGSFGQQRDQNERKKGAAVAGRKTKGKPTGKRTHLGGNELLCNHLHRRAK